MSNLEPFKLNWHLEKCLKIIDDLEKNYANQVIFLAKFKVGLDLTETRRYWIFCNLSTENKLECRKIWNQFILSKKFISYLFFGIFIHARLYTDSL